MATDDSLLIGLIGVTRYTIDLGSCLAVLELGWQTHGMSAQRGTC